MDCLERISREIMVFMRGKYRLDEIEVHYADESTWGILPYVPYQYEKQ